VGEFVALMLLLEDVKQLACPFCRGALAFRGFTVGERLERGALSCSGCKESFRVGGGLARILRDQDVRGTERMLRRIYDGVPWLHDPLVAMTFPLIQNASEESARQQYITRLELGRLSTKGKRRKIRILEVSVGTGANVVLLRRELPAQLPVEIWGIDLSEGMLGVLRRRLEGLGEDSTRFLMADAHSLPFPDHSFDRVFHVGGLNGFRDPRAALSEMSRVALPGSPIVVVDEQLDPDQPHSLARRAAFRFLTWFDGDPHSPIEHLPPKAEVICDEQIGPFFYCLTFRA
jgi:SAM-dependent methyltransferase